MTTEQRIDRSLRDAIQDYLTTPKPDDKAGRQQELRVFARWFGEERPLQQLSAHQVETYADRIIQSASDPTGRLTPLRDFLAFANKEGWTDDKLAAHIKIRKTGVKAAKAAGFKVCTNTTVYQQTDMAEIEELFGYLKQFGVDGHMLSPAYGYSAVNDREIFMTRDDIHAKFADIDALAARYPLNSTPVYLDFLQGGRELPCTAWGNPTYNIKGWKGPCYLITDAHHDTFEELMTKTPWENYGHGNDPRCEQCMVHCGYEPSAAYGINAKLSDPFKTLSWLLG